MLENERYSIDTMLTRFLIEKNAIAPKRANTMVYNTNHIRFPSYL